MPVKQKETPQTALPKIKQYCAFQERAHQEVRDKLYGYGLYSGEVESIISLLIENNYLNEERFAVQYAGGKFRMKQWGKIKIKYGLKAKGINDYLIRKAVDQIDSSDYKKVLQKLALQKMKFLKSEKNHFTRKKKLKDFLMQKGYEGNLVNAVVQNIEKT